MIIYKTTSKLLDRETPQSSKCIPRARTSAVLSIKQDPQDLIIPAQAAVQNQQEVSVAVWICLEASVYGSMTCDENQLQGGPPQKSPLPTLAPKSSTNPPQISGTVCQDLSDNGFSGGGVRPKDSALTFMYQMVKAVGLVK